MLLFIISTTSLPFSKINTPLTISIRSEPSKRITLVGQNIKVKPDLQEPNILIIPAKKDSFYILVNKKVFCHLTNNSGNLCKNGFNRSKEWEFVDLKNKGYLIRSRTANRKEARLCLQHDLRLEKCDQFDDEMRWDVGDDDPISGYEINEE